MRYALTCLRCGATIATTEYVTEAHATAVEEHLRTMHPDVLAGRAVVDYAELLGAVRVKMAPP